MVESTNAFWIKNGDTNLAFVLRAAYKKEGIAFFTPSDYSQQLAYMHRPSGYKIIPHVHNSVRREVFFTQEVLCIKSGRVKINFYDDSCSKINEVIVAAGDIVLLASGGHGFEFLEGAEIVEVKQGPYSGDADKTRFTPKEDK